MAWGLFFYTRLSFGSGFIHHDLDVLLHQLLETVVALDGLLNLGDLFQGDIAGNIFAVFIALVIVVRPLRALANDAQGAAFEALDLSDVLENRFGSRFCIHEG